MRVKLLAPCLLCAALLAPALFAQRQVTQTQIAQPQVKQTKLPEKPDVTRVTPDTRASEATNLPRPDLVVKEMCIETPAPTAPNFQVLRVRIANVGVADAGAFAFAVEFKNGMGSVRTEVDEIAGLKVGEEQWLGFSPLCCGWAASEFLVNTAVEFRGVVDATYYKRDPFDPDNPFKSIEVKSRVAESNERNNELVVAKSAVGRCGAAVRHVDRPNVPAPNVVRPPR